AQVEILNGNADCALAFREQFETDRVLQPAAENSGDFTRHSVMTPKIGAVCNRFIVDLDHAVRQTTGKRSARLRFELQDYGVIAIDAQFGAAGQHAVALQAVDGLNAHRNISRHNTRTAVGRPAHHGFNTVTSGIDHGLHSVRAGYWLDGLHARRASLLQQSAEALNAFALGGLHGDELLQGGGGTIQAFDQLANPVVGELQ